MIGLTRLVTGRRSPSDRYRYGSSRSDSSPVTSHDYGTTTTYRPVVVWNITQSCNLACQHCYYSAVLGRNPIATPYEDVIRVVDELADAGVPVLLFSGGEPLIRKDLPAIIRHTADRGITPVISTNGTLIRSVEDAERLKEHGAVYVGISVDGSEQTHDTFRRKAGAFRKTIAAVRYCQAVGLRVSMRFTITADNVHDLPEVLELADELGVARFCMYHLVPSGRGKRNGDVDNDHRRRIVESLCERAEEFGPEILTVDAPHDGPLVYLWTHRNRPERATEVLAALRRQSGDGTGRRIVEIDHDGVLHPNQFWLTHPIGNVRETSFRELWSPTEDEPQDEVLRELRREDWPLQGACGSCAFKDVCGGFRARANSFHGDLWAEDPSCPLTPEERATVLPDAALDGELAVVAR